MYKLLIADDEKQTREGLAFFFQNNPCGFEVIGIADGGLSALSLAGENEPDLVITDIRMPDLDGFALVERLAKLSKRPSVIIMSAYDDVEYFKSAFKLNALDYILKPIDTTELMASMDKVKKRLDFENEELQKKEKIRNQMQKDMPLLRARLFADLVEGMPLNMAVFEERMSFLNINLPNNHHYCTVMVSIDNKQETYGGSNRRSENALNYGMQNLLEELLEIYLTGYVFEYDKGDFALLLMEEGNDEVNEVELFLKQVEAFLDEFQNTLRKGTNIRATVGIGECVNDISGLPASFKKACNNVCKRLVLGNNRVIHNHEWEFREDHSLFEALEEVRSLISVDNPELLRQGVEQFFHNLSVNPNLDTVYSIQCSGMLLTAVLESCSDLNSNLKIDQKELLSTYELLGKTETIPDMMQTTLNFCLKLNHIIREKVADINSDVIHRVKGIIKETYMENISIQSIAEQIYLSPNYMCAIFKQETGQTINQYITHIRIEAAKTLLEQSMVRLSDIGYFVGYSEPSYFSKIFKKYTALTPKEYRQMLIGMNRTR